MNMKKERFFESMHKALIYVYVFVTVYCALEYWASGNEIFLILTLWGSVMLEIRKAHEITIVITRKENENEKG